MLSFFTESLFYQRHKIQDEENYGWFNIFTICEFLTPKILDESLRGGSYFVVFELVSAYGTVGLTLGIPTVRLIPLTNMKISDILSLPQQNYSLSGAFRPLSKLIVCLVMIRGRHRGLPVAIDRAVMLPAEFEKSREDEDDEKSQGLSHVNSRYSDGDILSRVSTPAPTPHSNHHNDNINELATDRQRRRSALRKNSQEMFVEEAGLRAASMDRMETWSSTS